MKEWKAGDLWSKPLAWYPVGSLRTLETGENMEKHIRLRIEQLAEWAKIPNLKDNIPILIVF